MNALRNGATLAQVRASPIIPRILRAKFEVKETELDKLDTLLEDLKNGIQGNDSAGGWSNCKVDTAVKSSGGVEYSRVAEIRGPLLVIEGVTRAAYDELVEIETADGRRLGRVLEVGGGRAVVQVFEGTSGLSTVGTKSRFTGKTMEIPVSNELLGRVFDGLGRPDDGLPPPVGEDFRDVNGAPINPEQRDYPEDFIQTGVSVVDAMMTLVRGQKLPIFSGAGMPHNQLAAQIAKQATVSR